MKKLLIGALLLSSCTRMIPTGTKVVTTDSTSVKQVKQTEKIKGSKVSELDVNKLMQQMIAQQKLQTQNGQPPQVVVRTIKDDNGVQLQFMLDAMGRFQADCSKKDTVIAFYAKQTEYWRKIATTVTVEKKKGIWDSIKDYNNTILFTIIGVVVIVVVLRIIKR